MYGRGEVKSVADIDKMRNDALTSFEERVTELEGGDDDDRDENESD